MTFPLPWFIYRHNGYDGQQYYLEQTGIGVCHHILPVLRHITVALHDSLAYQHILLYQWSHVERAEKNHEEC